MGLKKRRLSVNIFPCPHRSVFGKPHLSQLTARDELSSGRREKDPQALGMLLDEVKKLHHVCPFGIFFGHDMKDSASCLFEAIQSDLSEAHILFQLIEAVSQQILAVGSVCRKNCPIRIRRA